MRLAETKCPGSKKDWLPAEAIGDSEFYFELVDGKNNNSRECCLQVQLQHGLAWPSSVLE